MSQLNKTQLAADNQTSFPNNNAGFITPSILRGFNTNMIDSLVDEGEYNINSASFSGSIAALQNFSSSLDGPFATQAELTQTASILQADINTKATVTGSNKFAGSQTITGSLFITSNVVGDPHAIGQTVGGDLFINGAAGADVVIESDSTLTLNVNNGVTVNSTLNVDDLTVLEQGLQVTGSTSILGNTSITGNTKVIGITTLEGNTFISGNLKFDAQRSLEVSFITASIVSASSAVVTQTLSGSILNINGSATITGSTSILGNITGSSNLKLGGHISASGGVNAQGGGTFVGNLTANNFQFNNIGQSGVVSGSLIINQNLTVLGSSSVNYITSSQLSIGTNIISVNTDTPAVRFGGLVVNDSGSIPQNSGSFFYDSIENRWIDIHTFGNGVTSSLFILGPETYNNIGGETGITTNTIPKGTDNGEHIGNSSITDNGTEIGLGNAVRLTNGITGSVTISNGNLNVAGTLTSSLSSGNILVGNASNVTSLVSTASFASNASFNSFTASVNSTTASINSKTSSFATTGSNTFSSSQVISGSLDIQNALTASLPSGYVWVGGANGRTQLVLTSSIQGVQFPFSGSAEITGSLKLTGSLLITGSIPTIQNAGTTGSIVSTLGDIYTDVPAGFKIVTLTSSSYNSIATKDPNTLYFITGSQPYGSSGTSGTNGTSGVSLSGTNGSGGTSGTSGANGTNGVVGSSGTSGVSGTGGTSGTSGFNGAPGNPGSSGTSGTSGVSGTSGTSGVSGTSGSSGTSGESQKYLTTSTTSISIGSIGNNRTITVDTNLDYSIGQAMVCAYDANNYMEGTVVSYNDATGSLTFQITLAVGSGTYAVWTVNLQAATGATGPAGTSGTSGTGWNAAYVGDVNITGSFSVLGSMNIQVGAESGSVVDNRNDTYLTVPRIEHIVTLTEAQYTALAVPDVNTLYVISGSAVDGAFPYSGSAQITGSLGVTGSISNNGVAVINSSVTSSMSVASASLAVSSSYALSSSFAPNTTFPYTGSAIVSGSLIITGSALGNVVSASIASSTASIDGNAGNFFTCLVTGSTFFNVSNVNPGETINILLTTVQGGNNAQLPTASFSSNILQPSGSRYTPSSGSGALDVLSIVAFSSANAMLVAAKRFI